MDKQLRERNINLPKKEYLSTSNPSGSSHPVQLQSTVSTRAVTAKVGTLSLLFINSPSRFSSLVILAVHFPPCGALLICIRWSAKPREDFVGIRVVFISIFFIVFD